MPSPSTFGPPDGWQRAAAHRAGDDPPARRRARAPRRGRRAARRRLAGRPVAARARRARSSTELAGPLGLAVGWVRLAEDLRRSSVAIVSAREEERRRLRRDLHDGLGPALTGVSLGLRTAVRQLERSATADDVVARPGAAGARRPTRSTRVVVEVKRIVRDLRPTALDQLGLVGAVAEFTRTFDDDLRDPPALPPAPVELPAAVEVATYRIVTEAVTNVVRHARAAQLLADDRRRADGRDRRRRRRDRVGDDVAPGVGWTAMRERAAELGGTVSRRAQRPTRHPRPRPAPGGAAVNASGRAAAGGDRRRPPDVPHGAGRGDRRDGRHRAGRGGRAGRPGRRRSSPTPRRTCCCSTCASTTPPASRSTAGSPSTTRRSR